MKKIVFGIMVVGALCSSLFGMETLIYAHIDKENEKLTVIDKNPSELNDNDEILIISSDGVKINRSGKDKDKDNTLCTNRKKNDEDKLCRSIFGTSTSVKAVASNSTYGVLGNSIAAVISFGIIPAAQGLTYYVYEDIDKLNEFIKNNNLEISVSNLKEENNFKKKYADVVDAINLNQVAYNDAHFVQKLNEQTSTLDKMLAQKQAEQERIASEKQAEQERIASEKQAEQERIASEKEKGNRLFEKVKFTKKNGFGDTVESENCKIFLLQTIEEVAQFYKETWVNPSVFNMDASFLSTIGREAQVTAAIFDANLQYYGASFNMEDLSLQKEDIKINGQLSSQKIINALALFCLKTGTQVNSSTYNLILKKKFVQLLQAYIAANNLTDVKGSGMEACRYWPKKSSDVLKHLAGILSKYSRDKAAVKLILILASDKSEEEKIQILLKQPNVKMAFDIISK